MKHKHLLKIFAGSKVFAGTVLAGTLLAGLAVSGGAWAAGGGSQLEQANVNVSDTAALQRGARLFVDYCSGCHSAQYMRYKRLSKDLGYSEDEVLKYLAKPGSKIGDAMTVSLTKADGEDLFGVAPPDLSLVARTRGTEWLAKALAADWGPANARAMADQVINEATAMSAIVQTLVPSAPTDPR